MPCKSAGTSNSLAPLFFTSSSRREVRRFLFVKMTLGGIKAIRRPTKHLHSTNTQINRSIPCTALGSENISHPSLSSGLSLWCVHYKREKDACRQGLGNVRGVERKQDDCQACPFLFYVLSHTYTHN